MLRATRIIPAAHYGVKMLNHTEFIQRFQLPEQQRKEAAAASSDFVTQILPPLQRVEKVINSWKLNRWENRVPLVMNSEMEKELARKQLFYLKKRVLNQRDTQRAIETDIQTVCDAFECKPEDIHNNSRKWAAEKISQLRWKGEVAKAKEAREAWMRVEERGELQHELLSRLCSVYGLARMGTFENAFSNMILPTTSGNTAGQKDVAELDMNDPFKETCGLIGAYLPTIDILHDLCGMNTLRGYTPALASYMAVLLRVRDALETGKKDIDVNSIVSEVQKQVSYNLDNPDLKTDKHTVNRLLYKNIAKNEFLFACSTNSTPLSTTNPFLLSSEPAPIADFMYVSGGDVTLIAVASDSVYKREVQLPNQKQLEGIARRAVFVFGGGEDSPIDYDSVRIRSLLLPPRSVDLHSLRKVDRVLGLSPPLANAFGATTHPDETVHISGDKKNADEALEEADGLPDNGLSRTTVAAFPWAAEYRFTKAYEDVDFAAQKRKHGRENDWKQL